MTAAAKPAPVRRPILHYQTTPGNPTVCGRSASEAVTLKTTKDVAQVTCKRCQASSVLRAYAIFYS